MTTVGRLTDTSYRQPAPSTLGSKMRMLAIIESAGPCGSLIEFDTVTVNKPLQSNRFGEVFRGC